MTDPASGERFDLDRPGAIAAWNRALNRRYAMENVRRHPSRLVRWIEARRHRRLAARVPRGFLRAADLGSEDGTLASRWADRGRFVALLDLDPEMLRRARGRPVSAADAGALPFRSSCLDVVVASALLEHVVDPAGVVAECRRVLRPGGLLLAWVPWDAAIVPLKRWAHRLGFRLGPLHADRAPGHLRTFDRASLRALFAPGATRLRIRLDVLSLGYTIEAVY